MIMYCQASPLVVRMNPPPKCRALVPVWVMIRLMRVFYACVGRVGIGFFPFVAHGFSYCRMRGLYAVGAQTVVEAVNPVGSRVQAGF